MSNLVQMTCFWNDVFIMYTQNREIGELNNSEVFGSNKIKGHKLQSYFGIYTV